MRVPQFLLGDAILPAGLQMNPNRLTSVYSEFLRTRVRLLPHFTASLAHDSNDKLALRLEQAAGRMQAPRKGLVVVVPEMVSGGCHFIVVADREKFWLRVHS